MRYRKHVPQPVGRGKARVFRVRGGEVTEKAVPSDSEGQWLRPEGPKAGCGFGERTVNPLPTS